MKEIIIYVPTDPKVELPEPGMLVYATIKVEAIKFMVVASIDDDTGKWIEHLEETNNLDVIEWLKPVTISEKEINQAIELLLAAHLTLIDENRRDGSWPQKHIARKSFDEKKQAILALMKGEEK